MGLKADRIYHAAGIIGQRSGKHLGCSTDQAGERRPLVPSPEQPRHGKKRGGSSVIDDGMCLGIYNFGHAVRGPLGGLVQQWHSALLCFWSEVAIPEVVLKRLPVN